jgi:hypothetical protein
MKFNYSLLFFLVFIHCPGQVVEPGRKYPAGETNKKNDLQLSVLQTDYINKLYYKVIATPKDIINGKECLPYSFRSETTPMFHSREKLSVTLNVNNRLYKNVKIQYDTYLDELIYTDTSRIIFNEFPRIDLNKDIIEGFSVFTNGSIINFRHLRFNESQGSKLTNGFYEIAYEGPTRFIIRHRSTLYNKQGMNEYKYSPERYLLTENKYNKIINNKNLILLLSDHSREMKNFLQKSKIRVKKAGKDQIVEVLKYYDSLKASESQLQ